ncbi:MAG: MaoC/PaaZ C-terminal domain-containing protein [Pseudomonadota bacterium]
MLDADRLRSLSRTDLPFLWRTEQSSLYALSVGLGRDSANTMARDYVIPSAAQQAIPTMATVMSVNVFEQDYGWDYTQMLHGEQRLKLHRPLRPAADMLADFRVEAVHDKGANRPAIIVTRTDVRQAADNIPLFTASSTLVARADGGFDGPRDALPQPTATPDRPPDLRHDAETRPEQALLYRFNGDHNPLHVDPQAARAAGFHQPILHGLCTYGFACNAILETICDYDSTLIGEINARFTAPVYPGDTITTEMWQSADRVAFRCRVAARDDVVVLDNGHCRLLV